MLSSIGTHLLTFFAETLRLETGARGSDTRSMPKSDHQTTSSARTYATFWTCGAAALGVLGVTGVLHFTEIAALLFPLAISPVFIAAHLEDADWTRRQTLPADETGIPQDTRNGTENDPKDKV